MNTQPRSAAPRVFAPGSRLPRGADLVLRCTCSDMASRAILKQIVRRLKAMGVTRSSNESIEIVLAEALNNVVEHAYAGRADGPLELRAYVSGAMVRFELVDEGAPMPGLSPPQGSTVPDDIDPMDTPEGGFGWHLIRSLTHDLSYFRDGRYNFTTFDIAI